MTTSKSSPLPSRGPAGRRRAAAAVLAGVVLATTAACSSGDKSASGSGPVTIRFATETPTNGDGPYRALAKAFEAANPDIKVEVVETPLDSYANVLRTQLRGGNAPDVFYGSPGTGNTNALLTLADAGLVESLSDQAWAADAVPASSKKLFEKDGKIYAVPLDLSPSTEIINQSAYQAAGLQPATTMDELLQQCATLKKAGKSLFAVAGSNPGNLSLMAMEFASSSVYAADPEWNTERADKKVTFAGSAEWKQVLDDVVAMKDAGCFQEGVAGAGFAEITQALTSGSSLGIFAPGGAAVEIAASTPGQEFAVAVPPGKTADDTRLTVTTSNAIAVSAESEHLEAAKKFVEFATQPAQQDAFAKISGNLSLTSLSDEGSAAVSPQLANISPFLADQEKQTPLGYITWSSGAVTDAVGTGVQGLLTGQTTPADVLKAMDAAYDAGAQG
ncbi:ABC transporter substrate-binding protein [Kineococcus rhizosphaerae]|uniref:Carbohydrate ABC transporter substrate-binding protein (CUT1 family) n=1 Tax=Kineococcus rhizosphaerae TaxID=559628 RepID=A0A2T0R1J5_9ACTN|nr:extracellular solute-binding protein [Kineococcus rhizosphaerae]PRY13394.1 carbohydrate ABC transporter substrate-binding protein (CUT1 family) [Kineococcus rhizosphaerae]